MSTGQVVGGIVGAVVGFFTPIGPVLGAQLGMGIGGFIDPPKGPQISGPRLSDLTTQTSTYGATIPRGSGVFPIVGNVFWLENNKIKETSHTTTQGGKGGGGAETTNFTYSATFAVGLLDCTNGVPIAGLRRLWVGPKLVYDAGSNDVNTVIAGSQTTPFFRVYTGSDTQLPDPRMQAALGVANTPAYRGLAYIVFYDYPLKDCQNSLMGAQVKAEVMTSAGTVIQIVKNGQVGSGSGTPGLLTPVPEAADFIGFVPTFDNGTGITSVEIFRCVGGVAKRQGVFDSAADYGSFCLLTNADAPAFLMTLSSGTAYNLYGADTSMISFDFGFWYGYSDTRAAYYGGVLYLAGAAVNTQVRNGKATSPQLPLGASSVGVSANKVFCPRYTGTPLVVYEMDKATLALTNTYTTTAALGAFNRIYVESDSVFYVLTDGASSAATIYRVENGVAATWASFTLAILSANCNCTFKVTGNMAVICNPRGGTNFGEVYVVYQQTVGNTVALSSIVSAECLKSKTLSAGDIDVTALTQAVRGYRINSVSAIRGGIDPLIGAWPFDVIQSGYKIVCKPRGGASAVTIPVAKLDARAIGSAPGVQITNSREMDLVLPNKVSIKYFDIDREYDTGEQYAERLNTQSANVRAMEMALVLSSDEAAQKAEILLYLYWLERYDVAFKLPPEYNGLEPSDVITITAPGATYQLRLTAINYTSDGRLECQAKYANAATYVSTAGGGAGASVGQVLSLAGPTQYELLDIPLLQDIFDTAGFPVAMSGYLAGWPGGVLMRSDDVGQTWAQLQAFSKPGSAMGYATSILGAHSGLLIDKASVLAAVVNQALSSVTELQMLNGANYFAYGLDGRWEIIAAQNCVLQGDGSYVLTDLLRGRFGSEWATGLHAANDHLILLGKTSLQFEAVNLNTIGMVRTYRGITNGRTIDTDSNRTFTYKAVNLECLSPVYLNGNRNPSTNDWTLTWIRRTRKGGELRDLVDASLSEASESYSMDIFADGTYAVVKRTLAAATPTLVYTSAQQVTDFGTNQATLYIKLYQLSANVGRGYPLTASITR